MSYPVMLLLRWFWWSWVACRWSGGGPTHHSYAHARFAAHMARINLRHWLRSR